MLNILLFLCFLLFTVSSSYGGNLPDIEKAVTKRTENDPISAYEYFLEQIEAGAAPEEQAVYLYGMGLAQEHQDNFSEAVNDYLAAEALGNKRASHALKRLQEQMNGEE